MPIGISEDHLALHDAVRGWVERHASPAVLPAPRSTPTPRRGRRSGPALAEQGWLGSARPRGRRWIRATGSPEAVVVVEELAHAGAPGPALPTLLATRGHRPIDERRRPQGVASWPRRRRTRGHARSRRRWRGSRATPDRRRARDRGTPQPGPERAPRRRRRGAGERGRVRRRRSGWRCPVGDGVTVTELPSVDPTRRVAEVVVDTTLSDDPRARRCRRPSRSRDLVGRVRRGRPRGPRAVVRRDRVHVRQGPRPVRPSDRAVPGRQAQVRRHVRPRRARARRGVGRRARGRRRRWLPRWRRRRRSRWRSTPRSRTARTACRFTAASGSRGSTTPTCTCDARWRCAASSVSRAEWNARAATRARWPGIGARMSVDLGPEADAIRTEAARVRRRREGSRRRSSSGAKSPTAASSRRRGRRRGDARAKAVEQIVIDEEFRAAKVARPSLVIGAWALPPVIMYGTIEQQERWIRADAQR